MNDPLTFLCFSVAISGSTSGEFPPYIPGYFLMQISMMSIFDEPRSVVAEICRRNLKLKKVGHEGKPSVSGASKMGISPIIAL